MDKNRKQRATDFGGPLKSSLNGAAATQILGGRFSMAVPQRAVSRSSMLPQPADVHSSGLQVPATVGRQGGLYGSQNLGLSGGRRDAGFFGRQSVAPSQQPAYAPPSVRRSSIGRRQSAGGPQASNLQAFTSASRPIKDPRNVRDKAYLARCQNEIIDYLSQRNYPDTLTSKTLAQPTGKDFANIFKFLYSLYDPSHRTWGKKFEDDVALCLRTAGYPFADSISKSHIQAVGNMHSWPGIVAMLHWFVTSIKARERALDGYSELRIDPSAPHEYAGSEEERPQAKLEYWIEYLATVYPAFLASDDFKFTHVPDAEATLQERFDASNEKSRARLQSLSEQNERLQAEVDRLRTTPSELEVKQKERGFCQKDMEAILKYVSSLQDKSDRIQKQIEEFTRRIAEVEQSCQDKERERASLKAQVDAQGLSDHEIQKLTSDRHQLDEAHRVTSAKLSETMQHTLDLEVSLSRTFNHVEKLADSYHALATKLGLLPVGPEGYEDVNFAQELNGSAKAAAGLVPDCSTHIRPAILQMKQAVSRRRHEEGDRVIQVEEEVSKLSDRLQDLGESVDDTEAKYEVLVRELNASKEALHQYVSTSHASIDQITRQTNELKAHMSGGLLALDQRLQALENEHTRLLADVERLRGENHEAFASMLEAVINYKQYISTRLNEMLAAASEP